MKRRCCYIESLFLAGIICLSACGSKNPGVSKEELKKEFVKDRTQKDSPVEESAPSEFAEDYQAPPGIKYQPRIMTEGAIVLNVESALKNVRPFRLSDLGKEVNYKKMEPRCDGSSLIRIDDDFLVFAEDGLWLLDRDFEKKKMLVRSDLKVIHSGGGSMKVEGGYFLRDFYYDPAKGQLRFTCRNMKTGKAHLVVTPWAELLASPQPVELKSIRSKLPIDRNYLFSMPDGYGMSVSCSDELYTMGLKGDTLCHFVLGDNERYKARLFEAEGDIVYYYQGNTMFYHAYGGKIYRIKNASTLEVAYKLDFGSLPHLTGARVAGGADVGNSYFLTSCVDTDRFLFLSIDKGYDSINARRNRSVKLYSLVYDKRSGEFFSLPVVSDKVNPEQPLIIADLPESLPFWPNRSIEGNPARFFSKSSLLELYPAQMRENGQVEKLSKTDNIWLIIK